MAAARDPYGRRPLTWVDRWGVWLSQRAVRAHLPHGGRLEVLELGCGYHATILRSLGDRFRRAVAVDYAVAPEVARDRRIMVVCRPIERALPLLRHRRFDVILLLSVLEHLADPQRVLSGCAGLLKPGGTLLVNVPTWRGKLALEWSAFRLGLSPAEEMEDHRMYYDRRDLWPLLVRAGFRPSGVSLRYHKFGLNLFAVARRAPIRGRG